MLSEERTREREILGEQRPREMLSEKTRDRESGGGGGEGA